MQMDDSAPFPALLRCASFEHCCDCRFPIPTNDNMYLVPHLAVCALRIKEKGCFVISVV